MEPEKKKKKRAFEFSPEVKREAYRRQRGNCACCGKRLTPRNEYGEKNRFAHHAIANQCGNPKNPADHFLRTADNCVWVCRADHWRIHAGGAWRNGPIAEPQDFRFSHGKDVKAHQTWTKRVHAEWDRLFPAQAALRRREELRDKVRARSTKKAETTPRARLGKPRP